MKKIVLLVGILLIAAIGIFSYMDQDNVEAKSADYKKVAKEIAKDIEDADLELIESSSDIGTFSKNSSDSRSLDKTTKKNSKKPIFNEAVYIEKYHFKLNLLTIDMTEEEAKIQAYTELVEEAALLEQASVLNFLPSHEEVMEEINFSRDYLEVETEENSVAYHNLKDIIEGLGISEDQYFNEFIYDRYFSSIAQENLYDEITKDSTEEKANKDWEKYVSKTVKEFEKINSDEISVFLKTYDITRP